MQIWRQIWQKVTSEDILNGSWFLFLKLLDLSTTFNNLFMYPTYFYLYRSDVLVWVFFFLFLCLCLWLRSFHMSIGLRAFKELFKNNSPENVLSHILEHYYQIIYFLARNVHNWKCWTFMSVYTNMKALAQKPSSNLVSII